MSSEHRNDLVDVHVFCFPAVGSNDISEMGGSEAGNTLFDDFVKKSPNPGMYKGRIWKVELCGNLRNKGLVWSNTCWKEGRQARKALLPIVGAFWKGPVMTLAVLDPKLTDRQG